MEIEMDDNVRDHLVEQMGQALFGQSGLTLMELAEKMGVMPPSPPTPPDALQAALLAHAENLEEDARASRETSGLLRRAASALAFTMKPSDAHNTLYIDLDGVMADFDSAFPALFGLDHRSLADDEMWGYINGHPSFFRDLPPMAGAVEFFRSIEHLDPVILTACPKSNYPLAATQKRAWVREHLSTTCLVLPVLGGRHKPLFMHRPGDVLIDDFESNCAAWNEAGGVAIRHDGDWTATRLALDQAVQP